LLLWLAPGPEPLFGQAVGTVSIGAALIEYDGFLASGAAVLAPALRFEAANYSIGGQASWTLFESGNQVRQLTAAAAWLGPPRAWWRWEVSGSLGTSKYAGEPAAAHLLAGARLHVFGREGGGWVSATMGASVDGSTDTRIPVELTIAGWRAHQSLAFVGTFTASWLGSARHVDLLGAVRWSRGGAEVEGRAGARAWAAQSGAIGNPRSGVYGEVAAVVPLLERVALTASGGNYPSDPVRRLLAAKYATAGLRVAFLGRSAAPAMAGALARLERGHSADGSRARLEVEESGDPRGVRVMVAGATTVELMADFTDWEPVQLRRVGTAAWETRLPLAPGVYRVNIRVDGGRWSAPAGTRLERGEFGGEVGVLVVR